MRLALRELFRRPGRFSVVGGALTLLVLLLLFLGGLLDGLFLGSTGAIRANEGDAVVFSDDARESFLRSSIDAQLEDEIRNVEGVAEVSGIGFTLLGVEIPGESEIADGAIAGYEIASDVLPDPPAPGEAYADDRLESLGAEVGDTLLVGPAQTPVEIIGWVSDTNYLGQNGIWVEPGTWRAIQNENRPDAVVADGEFQVVFVRAADGVDAAELRERIDAATGRTVSLSEDEAVQAIPGVPEQNSTFTAVIYVTLFVVGLVVALFFALLTLERVGLYAVLKAVGAKNRTLVIGLIVQAVVVALGAFAIGAFLTFLLAQAIPPQVPVQFELGRALFILIAVAITAILGGLVSLRRIIRVDPASAIGTGV
ncbi:MAG: ABC transporter permease [Acidimicrobiales bacterium]